MRGRTAKSPCSHQVDEHQEEPGGEFLSLSASLFPLTLHPLTRTQRDLASPDSELPLLGENANANAREESAVDHQ